MTSLLVLRTRNIPVLSRFFIFYVLHFKNCLYSVLGIISNYIYTKFNCMKNRDNTGIFCINISSDLLLCTTRIVFEFLTLFFLLCTRLYCDCFSRFTAVLICNVTYLVICNRLIFRLSLLIDCLCCFLLYKDIFFMDNWTCSYCIEIARRYLNYFVAIKLYLKNNLAVI